MTRLRNTLLAARGAVQDARDQLFTSFKLPDGSIPDEESGTRALIRHYDDLLDDLDYELDEAPLEPDAERRSEDDLRYFRALHEATGLSARECARRLGIDSGEFRGYLSGRRAWPYAVQFALEALSEQRSPDHI